MPLISIGLLQQQQAASAGVKAYPELTQMVQNSQVVDFFDRDTLNPTNAVAYYTSNITGTASVVMTSGTVAIATGTTVASDVDVRIDGMLLSRASNFIDGKGILNIDIIFAPSSAVGNEFFLGILLQSTQTALTALPTTARHIGIRFDDSADTNYVLTSGNNSAQSTTTTGTAPVDGTRVRLNINLTGADAATATLFTGSNLDTEDTVHTVTSYHSGFAINGPSGIHFFLNNEGGVNEQINVDEWSANVL